MQVHGPSDETSRINVRLNPGNDRPFAIVGIGSTSIFLSDLADADELLRAATEAKRLLAEAAQLYVVVEADRASGGPVTVTEPKPQAEAEQWARDNRYAFAGRLEVRPATQADLDDAGGEF